MKKKLIGMMLCAAMAASLLAGCGSSGSSGSDTAGQTEDSAGQEDKEDAQEQTKDTDDAGDEESGSDSLVIPVSATVTNLNPLLESMAEGAMQLSPYADELYYVDQDETRYYLAESCEVSEDGLTYTLKLKDNLKWHDGEAITADDVIFTADCNVNTDNGAGYTNTVFIGEELPYRKLKAVEW